MLVLSDNTEVDNQVSRREVRGVWGKRTSEAPGLRRKEKGAEHRQNAGSRL